MQADRRRDPYPWTWEIPLASALAILMLMACSVQVARSAANLLAGGGWTWPAPDTGAFASPVGAAFWTSLPGVLAGHADAGLTTPPPDAVAGPILLWTLLGLTQAVSLAAIVRVGVAAYRWGPGRIRGMATASEAEMLLGRNRLRKVAGIVRPDLFDAATPSQARHETGTADAQESAQASNPWRLRRHGPQAHR